MSVVAKLSSVVVIAAAMGCGGQPARAQVAPVQYWVPFAPFGGGSTQDSTQGQGAQTYGDFPSFTASDGQSSGFAFRSYSAPVGPSAAGLGGAGAFGNFGTLSFEGADFGYNFKGVGNMPVTVFGGVASLKYNPDVFTSLTSPGFSSSSTAATVVHGGVEFRPTSNLSLSVSAGFAQPSGAVDSDIRSSLLPGESPMFSGGRR
jgi:hypothetical protein